MTKVILLRHIKEAHIWIRHAVSKISVHNIASHVERIIRISGLLQKANEA